MALTCEAEYHSTPPSTTGEKESQNQAGTLVLPTATLAATSEDVVEQFFSVWSVVSAYNTATAPTVFTTTNSWFVKEILTYHWNDGKGKEPGTIGLQAADGTLYRLWQTITREGSGVVLVAWVVKPNFILPPGTYTVLYSDPASWSQNEETGSAGMTRGYSVWKGNP
ncbi:MAG: hypothetical protein ABIJ65_11845 [Chloroflexota bacterium]